MIFFSLVKSISLVMLNENSVSERYKATTQKLYMLDTKCINVLGLNNKIYPTACLLLSLV